MLRDVRGSAVKPCSEGRGRAGWNKFSPCYGSGSVTLHGEGGRFLARRSSIGMVLGIRSCDIPGLWVRSVPLKRTKKVEVPPGASGGFAKFSCGVTRWQVLRSEHLSPLKSRVAPLPAALLKRRT